MNELKQKALFETRHFKLTKDGIETYTKDLEIDSTNTWTFDEFSNKNRVYTEKYPKILYTGLLTVLVGLVRAALFSGTNRDMAIISGIAIAILGGIVIVVYIFFQKKYFLLRLDNDQELFILYNNPNKQDFDKFIEEFYKARKANYRKKYFVLDFDWEKSKLIERMQWLRKEDIISESEFEFAMEEIQTKMI
jgi:hypothetical protein